MPTVYNSRYLAWHVYAEPSYCNCLRHSRGPVGTSAMWERAGVAMVMIGFACELTGSILGQLWPEFHSRYGEMALGPKRGHLATVSLPETV